jgi:hypothetical protein
MRIKDFNPYTSNHKCLVYLCAVLNIGSVDCNDVKGEKKHISPSRVSMGRCQGFCAHKTGLLDRATNLANWLRDSSIKVQ